MNSWGMMERMWSWGGGDDDEVVMMGVRLFNVRDDEEDYVMMRDRKFVEMGDEKGIDEQNYDILEVEKHDVMVNGKEDSGVGWQFRL